MLKLIILLILIAGLLLGYQFINKAPKDVSVLKTVQSAPSIKTYKDPLGFQFEYPAKGFEVVPDGEENYFEITKTDHRKNFTGYVGYPPPAFIKGVSVKKADARLASPSQGGPVTLWVFDNPDKSSIDSWFNKYWYYPFVWGIFAQPGKGHIYPTIEATVSGQPAKSVIVSYQPGKPEFTYVANRDKMFMFKIIRGLDSEVVNQVLSSFKFTK